MNPQLIEERYALLVAERRKRVVPALIMTDAEKEIVANSYFPDFDFTGMTQEEYADTIDNFTKAHDRLEYYYDVEDMVTYFQKNRCDLCRLWDDDQASICDSCCRNFCGKCSAALETAVGYGNWGDYCVDCDEQRWTTADQKANIMDTKNREYKEELDVLARQRAIRQAEPEPELCDLCRLSVNDQATICNSCWRTFCGKCSVALGKKVDFGDLGESCVDCDRRNTAEQNREYKEESCLTQIRINLLYCAPSR